MLSFSKRNSAAAGTAGLAVVCYGLTPVFIRYFVPYLDPWIVNGIRYTIGALFWLPFVLLMRGRFLPAGVGAQSNRTVWRDALVPSAVNTLGQVGWGVSPYFITAPVMGFAYRFSFLFTVVLGFLFIPEERPLAKDRYFQIGAVVCVAGLLLMFWNDIGAGAKGSLAGIAVVLSTNLMLGAYAVSVRHYMRGYPARLSFGVISLYTAAGLLVLMFLFGKLSSVSHLDARLWGLLIASALIGIAFAHVLYYNSIHGLGAVVATGLLMAAPFITVVVASLALGERMTGIEMAGGVVLVSGAVLLVTARGRVEPNLPDPQDR